MTPTDPMPANPPGDAIDGERLVSRLRWRYSVKKFDRARKIAPEEWRALEDALVLSASSYGLQPWKFVVITDPATREQLLPLSYNQAQIVDCSHLVVFCIKRALSAADIDAHVKRMAEVRGVAVDALARFRSGVVADLVEGARAWSINTWAANQVFIALGNFMTSAALLGVDTCPMEGFEPAKYDALLGLGKRGLASTVVCAAGYRSPDCKYSTFKKVRFPNDQVIERIA
jgi:nitroreductase